jgi:excisionase family DNA binding protein
LHRVTWYGTLSELLTTKQIQDLLQIDRVTVYRMLNDGRLKGVKIGNQWRFPQSEIDRLTGEQPDVSNSDNRYTEVSDFPSDCVFEVQNIFAGILGVGAVTVSLNGEPLTQPTYSNPFCKLMLSNPNGRAACQASWKKIALKATGSVPVQVCHAGLSYMRSGIKEEGKTIAWLVAGQFYISNPDHRKEEGRIINLSEKLGLSRTELLRAALKIPVLKRTQLEKVQEWTPKVANTVQSILCERSDLTSRLQHIAEISTIHPKISHPIN